MLARLRSWWVRLVDGFWFVPAVTALAYVLLALVTIRIDREVGTHGLDAAFQGDADAARDILTTIAGSLITVAGLTFSLTIVVLTLVSSQFSPRAVRSLLADRTNQLIAGSFVGIFAYCLVVLRTIQSGSGTAEEFVPSLGVTLAIALALLALALLLLFIHHVGSSIQVSHIAARIAQATLDAIDRLYPEPHGEAVEARTHDDAWPSTSDAAAVHAPRVGYVQSLELDDVAAALAERSARVEAVVCPGDFVTEHTPVLLVWPRDALDEERARAVRRAVVVGDDRDIRQDAAFGVRQLADIALRALSPGVNDPTTAENCIAYLGAVLERLAQRGFPAPLRRYADEGVVVLARQRTFDDFVTGAFSEIGRFGSENPRIAASVLDALLLTARAAKQAGAVDRPAVAAAVGHAVTDAALPAVRTERERTRLLEGIAELEAVRSAPTESAPISALGS